MVNRIEWTLHKLIVTCGIRVFDYIPRITLIDLSKYRWELVFPAGDFIQQQRSQYCCTNVCNYYYYYYYCKYLFNYIWEELNISGPFSSCTKSVSVFSIFSFYCYFFLNSIYSMDRYKYVCTVQYFLHTNIERWYSKRKNNQK